MFQMAGGGMNMAMNPMMMGTGMAGMRPGMGMPMGGAMAMGAGRGGPAMINSNIPRGPRAAGTPPTGPMGGAGVGPQRGPARANHHYHPYSR